MLIVWIVLGLIVLALLLFFGLRGRDRGWSPILSESGADADAADRLDAFLHARGVKTRVTREGRTVRILVRRPEEERAKALVESFRRES